MSKYQQTAVHFICQCLNARLWKLYSNEIQITNVS